jgi:hypothetical protein
MNENISKDEIKNKILEKIQSGEVKMHRHAYFALKTTLIVLGLVLIVLLVVFIASFLVFLLNSNNLVLLPAFGLAGFIRLLLLFPWAIVFLVLLFMILMEVFIRHFAFAYHQPVMYSALAIFIVVLAAGVGLAQTPLHESLALFSRDQPLPLVTPLYHAYGEGHHRTLYVGRISGIQDDVMTVIRPGLPEMVVKLGPGTVLPAGNNFHVNDRVMIMCPNDCDGDNIEAAGVKKLTVHDFEIFMKFYGPGNFVAPSE